jgi:hypothetical protein
MRLNPNGAVARVYIFAHRLWRSFAGDSDIDAPERSDLCTLARTIFVSAPFAIACNLATLAFAAYAIWLFGFMLWLHVVTLGWVAAGLAIIAPAGLVWFLVGFVGFRAIKAITTSEAGEVIAEFYRAKKSRICPLIDIKEAGDETA